MFGRRVLGKTYRVLPKNSNCTVTRHVGETGVWCRQGLRVRWGETFSSLQSPFNTPWFLLGPAPPPLVKSLTAMGPSGAVKYQVLWSL